MADRQRLQFATVRVRTTVGATVIVGLALVLGSFALVNLLRSSLHDNVHTAAELRAEDVVSLIDSSGELAELAVEDEDDSLVQVLDRSGDVVAASANIDGEPAITTMRAGQSRTLEEVPVSEHDPYLAVARAADGGRFLVIVARTLEPVRESTEVVVKLLLVGIPGLLVLVAGTTWFVTGRALRPVEGIRHEVASISAAALDRRVPVPAGDDEIARLATTMNDMLDRLHASRDRQRRFVSDASHELRSPIASIRHQLEVALAHPERTSVDSLAPDLLAEDLRMERLVADLLLLARADEDALGLQHHPVDLDDIVLVEAGQLRSRGRVHVDTAGVSAGRVRGDPNQLLRLVRNLLDNAERHATSTVTIGLRTSARGVELSIADDGAGIPSEHRERVFDRFTRLDDARARDTGGAGLGLSIVAEVARAHGGTARLEDSAAGARFVVVLPAVELT